MGATLGSVPDLPGLPLIPLRNYLDELNLMPGELSAELARGGFSNLTYLLRSGSERAVLRRPPLGHVLSTAHDMAREFRILSALAPTDVPAPKPIHLCQDDAIIGAPFYLMELVEGLTLRSPKETAKISPSLANEISHEVMDVLIKLHDVNVDEVGLRDFGRTEGFMARQVDRWSTQLEKSHSRDLNGVAELIAGLHAKLPESKYFSIVHGDYRLDNCIIDPMQTAGNRVRAVIDWEMSTLGDTYADLGLFVVYWDGVQEMANSPLANGITRAGGFPSAHELLEYYSTKTGKDLSQINWYIAFGYFKLAVIAEGIHYRYIAGKTVGNDFNVVGSLVEPLIAAGLDQLR